MARIPRAHFLNRTWASHEHQRHLRIENQLRLVRDTLTRQLRNPLMHRRGFIRVAFSAVEYPDLMPAESQVRMREGFAGLFGTQGYIVSTDSGSEGFTVTLDWRSAGPEKRV